jgi:hypothetical protein
VSMIRLIPWRSIATIAISFVGGTMARRARPHGRERAAAPSGGVTITATGNYAFQAPRPDRRRDSPRSVSDEQQAHQLHNGADHTGSSQARTTEEYLPGLQRGVPYTLVRGRRGRHGRGWPGEPAPPHGTSKRDTST